MTPVTTTGDKIERASLVLGPLVMALGDLMHPAESADTAIQAQIIAEQAFRWYLSHLLLFLGLILFLPGFLALTRMTTQLRPGAGSAARILLLVGALGFSAIFAFEMLAGRIAMSAEGAAMAAALLATFFAGPIAGAVMPVALCFFVAVAVICAVMLRAPALRLPAVLLALGALGIIVEIVTSQVLFSQIGNLLILAAGVGFARRIGRESA